MKELIKQFEKIRLLQGWLNRATDSMVIEIYFESIFFYLDGISETLKNSKEISEKICKKFVSSNQLEINICKNLKNNYHNIIEQSIIDQFGLVEDKNGKRYFLMKFKKNNEADEKMLKLKGFLSVLLTRLHQKEVQTYSESCNVFIQFEEHSNIKNKVSMFPLSVDFLIEHITDKYEKFMKDNKIIRG